MLVPSRAYLHTPSASGDSAKRSDRDATMATATGPSSKAFGRKEKNIDTTIVPTMFMPPPVTPSKPMVIPTTTRRRRKGREPGTKDETTEAAGSPLHDTLSVPSSASALFAMTSLPHAKPNYCSDSWRKGPSRITGGKGVAKSRAVARHAMSSASPQSWGMLLTPPEETDQEISSLENDTTLGPMLSARSMSIESMPSLDTDTESLSSISNPATPGLVSSRHRTFATSKGEDCIFDHPLLPKAPTTNSETKSDDFAFGTLPQGPTVVAKGRYSFKSNLTASLRKIRSAAESFSTFTAPAIHPDDYLSRSLLSIAPQYTDERRPLPSIDPPDPALRQYLNPTNFSPSDFHFHADPKRSHQSDSHCTVSIQLQTYERRNRSDKASSPPVFASQQQALDAADGLPSSSFPRQREPRENSDFLRVIVLEMNMRKVGKLSHTSPGKAKLWLPARQNVTLVEEERENNENQGTPKRWAEMRA